MNKTFLAFTRHNSNGKPLRDANILRIGLKLLNSGALNKNSLIANSLWINRKNIVLIAEDRIANGYGVGILEDKYRRSLSVNNQWEIEFNKKSDAEKEEDELVANILEKDSNDSSSSASSEQESSNDSNDRIENNEFVNRMVFIYDPDMEQGSNDNSDEDI